MNHALIADDHEVTRRGLREILREAWPEVAISEAGDHGALRAMLPTQPWDLILLDVFMPGATVLDGLAAIREAAPRVPVLVLTAATGIEYVVETMKAGASGLIHKHRAADDLVEAIARVAAGGTYLHPDTAAEIATSLRPAPVTESRHDRLSPRELEIFRLIALGRAIKEIAAELEVSDKTVATYVARIREKTGLTTYVEIARYALHQKLVT
ncbi:MAG: response regulator transcription factor [Deltaproteobacteria bacterium]|nr:response regulator transcription factor [Deltaproteobacteria bacterium]